MRLDLLSPEVREFVRNAKTCINCGIELLPEQDKGYCSFDCYIAKSHAIAYIEHRFKAPIRTVLVTALNTYSSITEASKVLSISRHTMMLYMQQYKIKRVYR